MSSYSSQSRARYYRLPFESPLVLQDILGYTRPEIHKFLGQATVRNDNDQISKQEKADLEKVWHSIIDPFFCNKFSDISPVNIKVHGVVIKVFYINCAISAVLSITMTNPIAKFTSTREAHDWALFVAVVLGALSFKSKNEMSNLRWRQERLESLEDAIHGPSRGILAPQIVLSRNTSPDQNRDGNCAETVPMMVVAARRSSEVFSIAIRLVNIPDRDCNPSILVHCMEGSKRSGSNFTLFQAKACENCLRFFDLLREKKGIRVVHDRLCRTEYPLALMNTDRQVFLSSIYIVTNQLTKLSRAEMLLRGMRVKLHTVLSRRITLYEVAIRRAILDPEPFPDLHERIGFVGWEFTEAIKMLGEMIDEGRARILIVEKTLWNDLSMVEAVNQLAIMWNTSWRG
ncbi:hypothetical protein P167DRAFT_550586 [Morchella conica CCBAS932]|uniref:Tyrosine specific protein phosphatases domain-containing protein n=1 Tax=Morchella conica CCBAS932 TaxID=1392247 RepID=A0A3N4KKK2_9PEZI|nr:hypothetical protein P167DRAFT_550586 [Morchella conica CCBAS932]